MPESLEMLPTSKLFQFVKKYLLPGQVERLKEQGSRGAEASKGGQLNRLDRQAGVSWEGVGWSSHFKIFKSILALRTIILLLCVTILPTIEYE